MEFRIRSFIHATVFEIWKHYQSELISKFYPKWKTQTKYLLPCD